MDGKAGPKHAFQMEKGTLGWVISEGRKAKGLSRADLAAHFNVTEQAVGQWERNETRPTNSRVIAVCKILEIDAYAAEEGRLVSKPNAGLAPADVTAPEAVKSLQTGPTDVEVLGVGVGGDDGDFYFNGTVLNYVARPPGIRRAARVFAVNVIGESMVPRFEPGELVYCQATPPRPGDDVIVEMYPNDDGTPGKSYIKRFIKRGGGILTCAQFNPATNIEFDLGEVKDVFRIIPLRELMNG